MWIKCNLTSFHRLCVLAAQELLVPLLARVLFLGCTVHINKVGEKLFERLKLKRKQLIKYVPKNE